MNAEALAIVTNPGLSAAQTGLRLTAWAVLMSQRGLRVNQFRVNQMQRSMPALTVLTGLNHWPTRPGTLHATADGAA